MAILRGKVVVITGASSGIGRAAALEFASRGARLALASRDDASLAEVAELCRSRQAPVIAVPTDVSDEHAVARLREKTVAEYGRIDVWVNDAAVYAMGRFEDLPSDVFRRTFEVNVFGVSNGARSAIGQFRAQVGGGTLINVGSVAGRAPYAEASAYSASKHAVAGLTEALRQELRGSRIDVCLVVPATVDTPLFQHAANFTGREVKAMPPIYAPERVARAIVSCAERPRRTAVVGAAPRLMQLLHALLPYLYERTQPRMVERSHLGHGDVAKSRGNLDAPTNPHAVRGGWQRRRPALGRTAFALGATLLPLAALGVRRGWFRQLTG